MKSRLDFLSVIVGLKIWNKSNYSNIFVLILENFMLKSMSYCPILTLLFFLLIFSSLTSTIHTQVQQGVINNITIGGGMSLFPGVDPDKQISLIYLTTQIISGEFE